MRIGIVGAGAMGCVFGGYLAHAGNEVWLIDVWQEHVDAIRRSGLRLDAHDSALVVYPHATTDPSAVGPCDLILIFVKSIHTAAAAQSARALLGPKTVVLTLQNGMGNVETIAAVLGADRVIAGVTYRGGEVRAPGVVMPTATDKETILGELDGTITDRVTRVVDRFNAAGLRACTSTNVRAEMWGKFLVNVAGNAMSAVTGMRLGQLLTVEASRQLIEQIVREAVAIANALGITLPYPDPMARLAENWRTLVTAKSSMLQDLEKGRRTEIDALNGYIVGEGERLGVPVPYNRAVTLMIKALEGSHELAKEKVAYGTA